MTQKACLVFLCLRSKDKEILTIQKLIAKCPAIRFPCIVMPASAGISFNYESPGRQPRMSHACMGEFKDIGRATDFHVWWRLRQQAWGLLRCQSRRISYNFFEYCLSGFSCNIQFYEKRKRRKYAGFLLHLLFISALF